MSLITTINANAIELPFNDGVFQCVVTSPPYWGLRDYGTAIWEGGGAECDHVTEKTVKKEMHQTHASGRGSSNTEIHVSEIPQGDCIKCGARRIDAQIGLEPTPALYVANIVKVMREVWRVTRDDATVWLNLGDSYNGGGTHHGENNQGLSQSNRRQQFEATTKVDGLKPKDLCGIPWRVAFALQGFALISIDEIAALCRAIDSRDIPALDYFRAGFTLWEELSGMGWFYNRSDIIWHKPNPMPESVTDRPTKAHEYVFLLSKQPRYYYDAEAIKEVAIEGNDLGVLRGRKQNADRNDSNRRIEAIELGIDSRSGNTSGTRNRRSVWTVATSPYSGAHFATFPPALVEPMILAGTSQRGACPTCGAGWVKVVDRDKPPSDVYAKNGKPEDIAAVSHPEIGVAAMGQKLQNWYNEHPSSTLGWRPACACYDAPPLPDEPEDVNGNMEAYRAERARVLDIYAALPTVPQMVLDPFAGTATVGRVCAKLGRSFVGIELNLKYIALADERTSGVQVTMPL